MPELRSTLDLVKEKLIETNRELCEVSKENLLLEEKRTDAVNRIKAIIAVVKEAGEEGSVVNLQAMLEGVVEAIEYDEGADKKAKREEKAKKTEAKRRGRKTMHGGYGTRSMDVSCGLKCLCGQSYDTFSAFSAHRSACRFESEQFICDVCFCYVDKEAKDGHALLHESSGVYLDQPAVCPVCDAALEKLSMLNLHYADAHGNGAKLCCLQCMKPVPAVSLSEHWKRFHRCEERLCPYCGKRFTLWNSYVTHLLDHEGRRRRKDNFVCDACGKSFGEAKALLSHRASKHGGEKALECGDCGKRFSVQARLRRHRVMHAGIKPFRCMLCDYASSRRTNVPGHVRLKHKRECSYDEVVVDEEAMDKYRRMFPNAEIRARARMP
jgi:hypothetical protein